VHYLVEERQEDARVVRRLAEHPSAVVYVLQAKRYSEMRRHLTEPQFAAALEQMLAIEKAGDSVRGVKIRRALFDVGAGTREEFLKARDDYYESIGGDVLFDKWPAEFRKPSGRLTASVVFTTISRSTEKSAEIKTIYAKQFFGYFFPVLDEVLTEGQKAKAAQDLRGSNVLDGSAAVAVDNLKDYGAVTLHYLMRDGKPLERPTAMTVRVTLTAKQIAEDPMIVRKHLAPAGADYLISQIREGEKAGQRLKSVEILRAMFDVCEKGKPDGDAAHAEFKKDIAGYCRQNTLIRPEAWPDRFRRPDGRFDVELTSTSIVWEVTKRE
jgi:hypothetical protein